jgi:hypothetical protein
LRFGFGPLSVLETLVSVQESARSKTPGDLTPALLFGTGENTLEAYQRSYLADLFEDSLGFAGAKIIR